MAKIGFDLREILDKHCPISKLFFYFLRSIEEEGQSNESASYDHLNIHQDSLGPFLSVRTIGHLFWYASVTWSAVVVVQGYQ